MKKAILCALFLSVYGTSATAADVDTDHLMFPEDVAEAIRLAEQNELAANAARTADRNDYSADDAWVGATKVEPTTQKGQDVKQLNRRFVEE